MFKPAARLAAIAPSPILALSARAAAMRAQGLDVIDLTVGEPDFETPSRIKRAAVAALERGATRYTALNGAEDLRRAVAERMHARHGLEVDPSQVIACTGAKQVIHNALAASLDPGAEVILPQPYWTSYADMIGLEGGQAIVAPSSWDDRRGWRLDPRTLEAAITARTRWLLINSPGNPSGTMMDDAERAALAETLRRHPHVWLLGDDIYEDIAFGDLPRTFTAVYPEFADRTLIVGGVSKSYAMTGWRLGWGVGPVDLIKAMATVQSQSTSAPSSISQAAAAEAIGGPQDDVAMMRKAFRERRDRLAPLLDGLDGWTCPSPDGAFYLFPRIAGVLGRLTPAGALLATDTDLSGYLLDDARVATVPGSVFGAPGHLRLSFAAGLERLLEAHARIAKSLRRLTRARGDGFATA